MVTVKLPEDITAHERLQQYVRSRRQQDGRKDWLFKWPSEKENIVPNETPSEEEIELMEM